MRREASPELIAHARHDRAAFGELYDQYVPRVYAFCRHYSDTREEAEDLTARTFERALGAIGRYEDRGLPFSSWLLRIAANLAIDRARATHPSLPLREEISRLEDDGQLREWEESYWLRLHVAALPEDQREVVRLRFFEDRRFADVAREMGRSEGAVKQLLRRALKALHRQIEGEGPADE